MLDSLYPVSVKFIMVRGRTLLERFRDPRPNEPMRATQDLEALADSILQHLAKMLNTRRGGPLIQPDDYGMIDLSDVLHQFPDSITDVQKAIRAAIEKYEPRLRNVKVDYERSEVDLLTLKFKITAQIAVERGRDLVAFETVVEPSGQVRVTG